VTNHLLIAAPSSIALPMSAEELDAAALRRWGAAVRIYDEPGLATNIKIDVPGQSFFQIDYMDDLRSVHCDGTEQQQIEVALWVRSLLPDDFPRVLACDQAWTFHVDLVPGMTEDEFWAAIVDHSVDGWDAADPDLR
jgi:hypothetical protein